jgi:hypothetical protein
MNRNRFIRAYLFFLLSVVLFACCFGNRKCAGENYNLRFRLLSKADGTDLVFGLAGVFKKDSIKVYSLNGADTVQHLYGVGPNPNPGNDSLLFISLDHRKYETIFFRLTQADTDTLRVKYVLEDGSNCCPDYTVVRPVTYNNTPIKYNFQNSAWVLEK